MLIRASSTTVDNINKVGTFTCRMRGPGADTLNSRDGRRAGLSAFPRGSVREGRPFLFAVACPEYGCTMDNTGCTHYIYCRYTTL